MQPQNLEFLVCLDSHTRLTSGFSSSWNWTHWNWDMCCYETCVLILMCSVPIETGPKLNLTNLIAKKGDHWHSSALLLPHHIPLACVKCWKVGKLRKYFKLLRSIYKLIIMQSQPRMLLNWAPASHTTYIRRQGYILWLSRNCELL